MIQHIMWYAFLLSLTGSTPRALTTGTNPLNFVWNTHADLSSLSIPERSDRERKVYDLGLQLLVIGIIHHRRRLQVSLPLLFLLLFPPSPPCTCQWCYSTFSLSSPFATFQPPLAHFLLVLRLRTPYYLCFLTVIFFSSMPLFASDSSPFLFFWSHVFFFSTYNLIC